MANFHWWGTQTEVMNKKIIIPFLALCLLTGAILQITALLSPHGALSSNALGKNLSVPPRFPGSELITTSSPGSCTSFCLDNGDHCVFGANQDNTVELGLLFVNQRDVMKTTWDPSTSGEYARWRSRYGSVTVNFVGFQMAWAGMNEAGLMLSTMSVADTRVPAPDERPPFQPPFWMQYQLDNFSTVAQVIASDAEIRLLESAVDHYLVCDRTGACATIEFFDHELVYHTAESLEVKALTNSAYDVSLSTWKQPQLHGDLLEGDSLWRFIEAAKRIVMFEPSNSDTAVAYAFDTLEAVSRNDTVWSFVFDPVNLRIYFRTNRNPDIRYLDFADLDFSCHTPIKYLDVHAAVSGDISDELIPYTHAAGFSYTTSFFEQFGEMDMSPILVDTLLRGLENSSCKLDDTYTQVGIQNYRPLVPVAVSWAILMLWHRVGLYWILLVVLSLVYVIWRMVAGYPASPRMRVLWLLLVALLGPFGLLAYVITRRAQQRKYSQITQ
jgi:choloylglycine hydrolase